MNHPRRFFAAALLLASLGACAPQQDSSGANTAPPLTTSTGVRIEGAELREGLPGGEDGVLYLTLTNTGETEVKLLGGRTPVAREIVPMRDHSAGGTLAPTLAPGEELAFKPGGNHLMLMDLKRPPEVGEKIDVTLNFAPGGEVTLSVPVNPY